VPDKNLGHYVSRFLKDKEINTLRRVLPCTQQHRRSDYDTPKSVNRDVRWRCIRNAPGDRGQADFVGSTAQIIDYVGKSPEEAF
jgi:quinolinate synthase